MHRTILFFILYLLNIECAKPCSCGYIPKDFIESINFNYVSISPFCIVKGYKIVDTLQSGIGCKYMVLQQIYGVPTTDTISIWGDPGWTCLDKAKFSVGDTTIILISRFLSVDTSMPYVNLGDYHSWFCGYYTMLVKGDSVYGGNVVSFTFNGYPLEEFLDSLNLTLNVLSTENYYNSYKQITIYPNPCEQVLIIQNEEMEYPIVTTILSLDGKILIKNKSFNTIISTMMLKDGNYYLDITDNRKRKYKTIFSKRMN